MMDQHEVKAIRRLWLAVLAEFGSDTIRKLHAAKHGVQIAEISNQRIAIGSFDHEVNALRRYMGSKDFRDVCDLAGVEVRVEPAISHMLRVARVFDGGRKGVTAELALNAWVAE